MSVAYAASIPARFHGAATNLPPTRVVIHATVSPCVAGGARNVATYFQSPQAGGSAHVIADPGELVRCVPDNVVAYHAPPNAHSLGIELCDPSAGDPARWGDKAHQAMLALAAGQVREWCDAYSIPAVWLSPADLVAGRRGITSHANVSAAWHETDHTDPGAGFPVAGFLDLVTGGDDDMTPEQAQMLQQVHDALYTDPKAFGLTPMWATLSSVARDVAEIKERVASMHAGNYGEKAGFAGGDLAWLDKRLNGVIEKLTPKKTTAKAAAKQAKG